MARSKDKTKKKTKNPDKKKTVNDEYAIQEAIHELDEMLADGRKPNIQKVSDRRGIPYYTLWRRFKGRANTASKGQKKKRMLPEEVEEVLVQWCIFLALIGIAQDRKMILRKAYVLSGMVLGKTWYYLFRRRHPEIVFRKPSGLDPKRAQCFNFPVVDAHFKNLKAVLEQYNIPWAHIWNQDEKGIQLGGGRKSSGIKYLFSRKQVHKMRLKSDSLELVTLMECVSADGAFMRPGFIYAGNSHCREWYQTGHDCL
jgi:hypothetical protein